MAGVDFDVNSLTAFMADYESADRQTIILTERGVVLAYPTVLSEKNSALRLTRAQHPTTLNGPVLAGFFRSFNAPLVEAAPRRDPVTRHLAFDASGEPMVAAVRGLGAGGPRWNVATLSKRKDVQSALIQYRRSSLLIGGGAVLLAMLSAWFLARFIVRERRAATLARAAARAAQRQARELGSYRLVSRLGQGGLGEVWRARHHLLARDAAIKLIRTGDKITGTKKRELEERFRREARALAALRSRNTIELFDYGLTAEGTLYYVMELLEGIDLQALVERFGPQPPERVRQILIQACNSLSEAHQVSLDHRDIKPANLFLCRAAEEVDVLKVLDFGLVLSPMDSARSDPRITQFALQSQSNAPLSPTFAHIITQCLQKNADDRPQCAADLLQRLRNLPPEPGHWGEKQAADWWAEHLRQVPPEPANVTRPPEPITTEFPFSITD